MTGGVREPSITLESESDVATAVSDGLPPFRAQQPLRLRARNKGEAGGADARRAEHRTVGATPAFTLKKARGRTAVEGEGGQMWPLWV